MYVHINTLTAIYIQYIFNILSRFYHSVNSRKYLVVTDIRREYLCSCNKVAYLRIYSYYLTAIFNVTDNNVSSILAVSISLSYNFIFCLQYRPSCPTRPIIQDLHLTVAICISPLPSPPANYAFRYLRGFY